MSEFKYGKPQRAIKGAKDGALLHFLFDGFDRALIAMIKIAAQCDNCVDDNDNDNGDSCNDDNDDSCCSV